MGGTEIYKPLYHVLSKSLIKGHPRQVSNCLSTIFTVLPAKSDSYVMVCLHSYQGLRIDRSLMYSINAQVIY